MPEERLSVWILGDQLLRDHPALAAAEAAVGKSNIHVVMIESQKRTAQRPYQRKKLVLIYSAMRHYAQMLREQGYHVDYYTSAESMTHALQQHKELWRPEKLLTMAASEYFPRLYQTDHLSAALNIPVEVLPNTQFLIGRYNPYPEPEKRLVMENFYRKMRRHFDVLMDSEDAPAGGEWNYDKQNRKPLPKNVALPDIPQFQPDETTQQVMADVAAGDGVGQVDGFCYAVTHQQAEAALHDFIETRLQDFGAYEDAMTTRQGTLFHAILSPYINLGLLEPLQMIAAVEAAYREGRAPINSVEGFVRQVLGWREYMYWQYWQQMPDLAHKNHWNAAQPMPRFFWNGDTEMNCLHHVITRVIDTGYTHHIERLMVVSNFCLMAGIEPRAVLEWFMSFYIDAYDWVMQPNVIGMGLNADGGRTATKPYIASANYINKMSDYCQGCRYQHTQRTGDDACPFNYLYWNFLIANEDELRANPRTGRNVLNLRHLDDEERARVQQQAEVFIRSLG
ncbi:MAG: cryptochrome/photolyase family protein [Anaerolineae bacterium]